MQPWTVTTAPGPVANASPQERRKRQAHGKRASRNPYPKRSGRPVTRSRCLQRLKKKKRHIEFYVQLSVFMQQGAVPHEGTGVRARAILIMGWHTHSHATSTNDGATQIHADYTQNSEMVR